MTLPSTYDANSPEIVPVTIYQTNLAFDGANAFFHKEMFSRTRGNVVEAVVGGGYKKVTLGYLPVSAGSITVAWQSAVQRPTLDYVVVGRQVYFTEAVPEGVDILVSYFALTGSSVTLADITTGSMVDFAGGTLAGFVKMDASLALGIVAYADLYAYATAHGLISSEDATNFYLRTMEGALYDKDSGEIVTVPKWIKT